MDLAATDPATTLRRMVTGYQVSQAIQVAATLGIADLLAGGTVAGINRFPTR